MGNDDLIAERVMPLAHKDRNGLRRSHVFVRAIIPPHLNPLLIRQSKVHGSNPSTSPFA